MDVQVKRWGNSIGFRIPSQIAKQLGIDENSVVELTATDDNTLTITPKSKPCTLDDLLDSIPDNFQYPEDVAEFAHSTASGRELL
ncbi:MAG: AbrB/MazE/SpoVT family DNA-binding domain-containing protein [Cyanobacteria bacterium J06627_28]